MAKDMGCRYLRRCRKVRRGQALEDHAHLNWKQSGPRQTNAI